MTVRKISVSLPEDVAEAVRIAAERSGLGLSAWITRAAAHSARTEAGLAAIAEWEREHEPITPADLSRAAATLADADAHMFGNRDEHRRAG